VTREERKNKAEGEGSIRKIKQRGEELERNQIEQEEPGMGTSNKHRIKTTSPFYNTILLNQRRQNKESVTRKGTRRRSEK